MGSHGQAFVRTDVGFDVAKQMAASVRSWLIETSVIMAEEDPSSVRRGPGHRPGSKWETAVEPGCLNPGFLERRTNGVRITGGVPDAVAYPNGGDLSASCPNCGAEIGSEVWGVANDWMAWPAGAPQPSVKCPTCTDNIPAGTCTFGEQWGFSLLTVEFFDWSRLSGDFRSEMLRRLGGNTRYLSGKF